MSAIVKTFEPPYYAVIFTSLRTDGDHGYAEMARKMDELAKEQVGYLGIESARENLGITVSYWKDLESIVKWHENAEHRLAQSKDYETWYQSFKVRICRVERDYAFER